MRAVLERVRKLAADTAATKLAEQVGRPVIIYKAHLSQNIAWRWFYDEHVGASILS